MTPDSLTDIPFLVVESRVKRALACFLDHEFQLLDRRANERNLTQRLSLYLQVEFPGWHVDCEFNRDTRGSQTDPKRQDGRVIVPDIVIHRRGEMRNLLVIEAKPHIDSEIVPIEDKDKLKFFTRSVDADSNSYGYRWGLFLNFRLESRPVVPHLIWFSLGEANPPESIQHDP